MNSSHNEETLNNEIQLADTVETESEGEQKSESKETTISMSKISSKKISLSPKEHWACKFHCKFIRGFFLCKTELFKRNWVQLQKQSGNFEFKRFYSQNGMLKNVKIAILF